MQFTAKQHKRLTTLATEGKQGLLDDLVTKKLNWPIVEESIGERAYVNHLGYRVNNIAAFRALIEMGVDPFKELKIYFQDGKRKAGRFKAVH